METRTLVQGSAQIVRITSLKKGDVYKRLETTSYSSPKLFFGTVTDVLNNGEQSSIIALEYDSSYSSVEVNTKVFASDTELALFAADPREYADHLDKLEEAAKRAAKNAYDAYTKADDIVDRVVQLRDLELTAAETTNVLTGAVVADEF